MIENRSAPPGPVVPVLAYQDVNKAIEWLTAAFGFTERLRIVEPDGSIHRLQLAAGRGGVVLVPPRKPDQAGKARVFVRVQDARAHYERAIRAGAKVNHPPQDHEYGERQYAAEDCEGNEWTFSQAIADVDPKEWGGTPGKIEPMVARLERPRFCYVEIPAKDAKRSAAFYEKVFGWNIRNRESARPSFDDACGVISGAFVAGGEPAREGGLLPYIWVDDLRASVKKVGDFGGTVVDIPHPDHPGGTSWIATFRDPAGNLMGLYQEDVSG
jgi:predicted enzyme related to lactoylglutathione lyase